MTRVLLVLVLLPLVAVAAPVPKGVKVARPPLDGTWELVTKNVNGTDREVGERVRWVVAGEGLTAQRGAGVPEGGYALVAPAGGGADALDHVITSDDGPRRVLPGVYAVDGDTLTFCLSRSALDVRPADCRAGPGRLVFTFRRVTDPER